MNIEIVIIIIIWCYLYLELDECCYSYASLPHNDTSCVPNGQSVNLFCAIINPHDNFTNLTVTWFRSTTEDTSIITETPFTSEEYSFSNFVSGRVDNSLSLINCNRELYRDAFSLVIHRFTQNKNGYYWCQLAINNTFAQPSYRAQFSVGECNITNNYYRLASLRLSENKCAEYVTATESDAGLTTTYESSATSSVTSSTESSRSSSVTQQERETVAIESNAGLTTANESSGSSSIASSTESSTRSSSVAQQEKESDKPITYTPSAESSTKSSSVTQQERESDKIIIYVAGSLSALVTIFGALIIILSILYVCKFQKRETSKSQ
jgi:hypothetical protein